MLKPLIIETTTSDEQHIKKLHQELKDQGINKSELICKLLVHRGIYTVDDAKNFLYPTYHLLYDPYGLKDMEKAVMLIQKHINAKNSIYVYGDYDVDGITSTSILVKILKACGANVAYYIPDRIDEGYGINKEAIDWIYERGGQLIISVDTGITAIEQVAHAKNLGLDMIITDHHECQEQIPKADAVINPKQSACNYPYKNLAGVGVTFKLAQALGKVYTIDEEFLVDLLEIAAIGTVADIVPLIDENRIIVSVAFERIRENLEKDQGNKGLKALLTLVGAHERPLTAGVIGFQIGPRLNAAGRLGDAKRGVELFLTDSADKAMDIATELDIQNRKRQEMEQQILEEADAIIQKTRNVENEAILVVASHGWHHGVIGIVASRLTEKYYRPTILLTIHEGIASGSARSVEGFSIFDALMDSKDLFLKVGGHEMAAGMSLDEKNIELLRISLNQYAQNNMSATTLIPKARVEHAACLKEVNVELIEELKCLEPYGAGNQEPRFLLQGYVGQKQLMGKEKKHFKMQFLQEENMVDVVAFNNAQYYEDVYSKTEIELIGTLNINEWKGYKKPQIFLKGMRYLPEFESYLKEATQKFEAIDNGDIDDVVMAYDIQCSRKDCIEVYRKLRTLMTKSEWAMDVFKFNAMIQDNHKDLKALIKSRLILEVFRELGLIDIIKQDIACYQIQMNKTQTVELEKSTLYNKIC
mgnify:CR=1 FL=1